MAYINFDNCFVNLLRARVFKARGDNCCTPSVGNHQAYIFISHIIGNLQCKIINLKTYIYH